MLCVFSARCALSEAAAAAHVSAACAPFAPSPETAAATDKHASKTKQANERPSRQATLACIPCGHQCMCQEDSSLLVQCPICRSLLSILLYRLEHACDYALWYARMWIRKMSCPVLSGPPVFRESIDSFIRIYKT